MENVIVLVPFLLLVVAILVGSFLGPDTGKMYRPFLWSLRVSSLVFLLYGMTYFLGGGWVRTATKYLGTLLGLVAVVLFFFATLRGKISQNER